MKIKQVEELVLQSLEHEIGGVQVYAAAVKCAVNADLKKEWEKYLGQTRTHVTALEGICKAMDLDAEKETPGRRIEAKPPRIPKADGEPFGSNRGLGSRESIVSGIARALCQRHKRIVGRDAIAACGNRTITDRGSAAFIVRIWRQRSWL